MSSTPSQDDVIQNDRQNNIEVSHGTATIGPRFHINTVFPGMGISMSKIRRSWDRLILNMWIPVKVRRHLYIETTPDDFGVCKEIWYWQTFSKVTAEI